MVIYDYDEESYNIWHMMIDKKYQGNGLGYSAFELCLNYIKTKPFGDSNSIILSCNKDNLKAISIYEGYGFTDTDEHDEDEIIMKLIL